MNGKSVTDAWNSSAENSVDRTVDVDTLPEHERHVEDVEPRLSAGVDDSHSHTSTSDKRQFAVCLLVPFICGDYAHSGHSGISSLTCISKKKKTSYPQTP